MADDGLASVPEAPPGLQYYNDHLKAGFSQQEMDAWKNKYTADHLNAGFTPQELDKYFGDDTKYPKSLSPDVQQHFQPGAPIGGQASTILENPPGVPQKPFETRTWEAASRIGQAFLDDAKAAMSRPPREVTALSANPDAMAQVFAHAATGGLGVMAGVAGAIGQAAEEVGGKPARYDANALMDVLQTPEMMSPVGLGFRTGIVQAYRDDTIRTSGEAIEHVLAPVAAAGHPEQVAQARAALEHQIPDQITFTQAAAHLVGEPVPLAGQAWSEPLRRVQHNLETVYAETGMAPWEAAARSQNDPVIRQELMGQDLDHEPVTPKLKSVAPLEPKKPMTEEEKAVEAGKTPLPPAGGETVEAGTATGAQSGAIEGEAPKAGKIGKTVTTPQEIEPLILGLETGGLRSPDAAVSTTGAIGAHQIEPSTARKSGFDPERLHEPEYNRMVYDHIMADLIQRYHGDTDAVLVAYNAGPRRANEYLASGRDLTVIPRETQGYLYKAGRASDEDMIKAGWTQQQLDRMGHVRGAGGGEGKPPGPPRGGGGEGEPPERPLLEGPEEKALPTLEEANAAFDEKVVDKPEAAKPAFFSRLASYWDSTLTRARELDDVLEEQGIKEPNGYGLEDAFRGTWGAESEAANFVHTDAIDIMGEKTGAGSLAKAAKLIGEGGDLNGWRNYMLAKRTIQKAEQGVDTGMPLDAATVIASDKATIKRYEAATKMWTDVHNAALDFARDGGFLNGDQVAAMKRDNSAAYIKFRRVMGDDRPMPFENTGSAFFKTGRGPQKMEGGEGNILDPFRWSVDNLRQLVINTRRNMAIGQIVALSEKSYMKDLGLKQLKYEPNATLAEPGSDVFKPYGIDDGKPYEPFLAERARSKLDPGQFIFVRNGVPERWKTKDVDLAQMINAARSPQEADVIAASIQAFTKIERAGIAIMPDFIADVVAKHQVQAWVTDVMHPAPVVTMVRGVIDHFNGGEAWDLWRRMGGDKGGTFEDFLGEFGEFAKDKMFGYSLRDSGAMDRILNSVKHPLAFANMVGTAIAKPSRWLFEASVNASRVGYFKKAVAAGIEPRKAAMMSRAAYLDMREMPAGAAAQNIARTVPFSLGFMRGTSQVVRAFKDHPIATSVAAISGITVPQILLQGLSMMQDQYGDLADGQKFSDIPPAIRYTHFITPYIPGVGRLMMPHPFAIGMAFAGMPARFMDWYANDNPQAFKGWYGQFTDQVLPPVIMPFFQPIIEQFANKSLYNGRPIVPDKLANKSAWMQYTDYTSEPMKLLSRNLHSIGMDVSPMVLDNYLNEWTGTLGREMLKWASWGAKEFHWASSSPTDLGTGSSFTSSFYLAHPDMQMGRIQEFETAKADFETRHADFILAKQRAQQGYAEGQEQMEGAIQQNSPTAFLDKVSHVLKMQHTIEEQVAHQYDRGEVTKDEARQIIWQAEEARATLASYAIEKMKALDKVLP